MGTQFSSPFPTHQIPLKIKNDSAMLQNPPSLLPPMTPGPIRVHRPRESPRYMPYGLPAAVIRKAHEHECNENCPPALSTLNIPVSVPMAPSGYLTSTPLRRHASMSALMDTNMTNWSPFTTPPTSHSAFIVDPTVYAQQVIRKLNLGRFQAKVHEFSQVSCHCSDTSHDVSQSVTSPTSMSGIYGQQGGSPLCASSQAL